MPPIVFAQGVIECLTVSSRGQPASRHRSIIPRSSASIRWRFLGRNSSLGLPIGDCRSWMLPLGARWIGKARFRMSCDQRPSFVLTTTTYLLGRLIASPAPGEASMTSALVTKLSMNAERMNFPAPRRCRVAHCRR